MTKIIAKLDFSINNKKYIKGDEIKDLSYQTIIKLNEKGFIEPLGYKDLVMIERELNNKKTSKEE